MVSSTTQPPADADDTAEIALVTPVVHAPDDAPTFGVRNFGNIVAVYVTMTEVSAHGLPFRALTPEQLIDAKQHLEDAAAFLQEQRALEYYKTSGKADRQKRGRRNG